MNTYMEITNTIIKSAADTAAWNRAPATAGGRCTDDINKHLDEFTAFRSASQAKVNGLWHLLTACWPAPGTIGLAWMGVLCSSQYGTGVSSWTGSLWLTIAHEVGHNFGANHAFQEGQGTTGGIMDYGDGEYPIGSGIYQFHSGYNKAEMCAEIQSIQSTTGITPYCWSNYAPVCGNGVVEQGEQCDDSSSCCSACRLTGQCTRGSSGSNLCCTATCAYAATSQSCNNGMGYCSNGQCQDAICSHYSLPFCGLTSANCKVSCGGPPSSYACSSSWTTPNCNIAAGTVCSTAPYSTCSGTGACTATTPPVTYAWVTGAPSACTCTGTNTRTVQCQASGSSTPVADSNCANAGAKPPAGGTCTAPTSCYIWRSSDWSACTVDWSVRTVLTESGRVGPRSGNVRPFSCRTEMESLSLMTVSPCPSCALVVCSCVSVEPAPRLAPFPACKVPRRLHPAPPCRILNAQAPRPSHSRHARLKHVRRNGKPADLARAQFHAVEARRPRRSNAFRHRMVCRAQLVHNTAPVQRRQLLNRVTPPSVRMAHGCIHLGRDVRRIVPMRVVRVHRRVLKPVPTQPVWRIRTPRTVKMQAPHSR
jgi:hypothetical protein